MNNVLSICYLYPELLNLYGDNGNVEVISARAASYGFTVRVTKISIEEHMLTVSPEQFNFVFMGGGPDSSQKLMYEDLCKNKKEFLTEYINGGGAGLYVCGAYQLLGHFYRSADGTDLQGLGILDLYTQHFGKHKPRCIGNTSAILSDTISADPCFVNGAFGTDIVGFENHGGRTYLGNNLQSFAHVTKGAGNNGEDGSEGALYKNSVGTYFHGPFFAKNPHVVDYFIAKALHLTKKDIELLPKLDDKILLTAHKIAKTLKR